MKQYGRIAVLAGGVSSEREISLRSGRAVYEALKRKGQNAVLVDMAGDVRDAAGKIDADIAFLALHGRTGEDGTVQASLEERDMPYTGSGVAASRHALDKIASRRTFQDNGVTVPRYEIVSRTEDPGERIKAWTVPLVVKPQHEGSSIGLSIVTRESEVRDALLKAFHYDENVLVEEYVKGRELTVGIFEERALPVIEIVTRENVYDFKAKYEDAGTRYIVPARLDDALYRTAQAAAERAHRLLGCRDFSRVDMRMDEAGSLYVLEVNTIPGMTERSLLPKGALAEGIGFDDMCMRLVGLAHKRSKIALA
jgi:D-alanine-D-alanine ligase